MRQGLTGKAKVAMLLIALGREKSTKVFKHLKEEEIEELTLEIASISSVTPEEKEEILSEFYNLCLAQDYIAEGGINYAQSLLEEAMGSDKANDLISKLTMSLQVKPFEFARKADSAQLINFIQDEHPQTIALVLSYLRPQQAAQLLSALPKGKQTEVAKRIAQMDRTSPDIIREVEKVLESKVSTMMNQDYASVGGVDSIVEILNAVDRGTEKNILETLEVEDVNLADEIRNKMFVFEDIVKLDNRSIQRILRDVDNSTLAVALKGSSEQVKEIVLSNVSKRLAEMVVEEIQFMGPVRLRDVEEAQQKIVAVIRKLEDAKEIVLSRGGGDEVVV
ncbi:MAG: flagellar motor switch protein FliG [Clostridia bacterium]|nr:flagellar motor switch protein FliG [Clostridia bacterium]